MQTSVVADVKESMYIAQGTRTATSFYLNILETSHFSIYLKNRSKSFKHKY